MHIARNSLMPSSLVTLCALLPLSLLWTSCCSPAESVSPTPLPSVVVVSDGTLQRLPPGTLIRLPDGKETLLEKELWIAPGAFLNRTHQMLTACLTALDRKCP